MDKTVVDGEKPASGAGDAPRDAGASSEIGVKSHTLLERNAHRLGIPQSALLQARKGEQFLRDEAAAHQAAKTRRRIIIGVAVVAAFAAIGGIHLSGVLRDVEVTVKVSPSQGAVPPDGVTSAPAPSPAPSPSVTVGPEAPPAAPTTVASTPGPSPSAHPATRPPSQVPPAKKASPPSTATRSRPPPDAPPGDKPLSGKPQF